MLLALVVKEAADLLGFVGPMALKGVVHYMAARQSPPPAPDPSAPEDITWEQVFANGCRGGCGTGGGEVVPASGQGWSTHCF